MTPTTVSAAREVQRRLLGPTPEVKGVDIAVLWRPFGEVGGDFYDFVRVEEETLGLTVGDVSGKGYDAALLMVFALAEVRARLKEHQRLAYVMAQIDDSLREYSSDNKFAEVLIGLYIIPRRRFIFVQGGTIVPVVFHRGTGEFVIYRPSGSRVPGIAVVRGPSQVYVEHSVDLERDDVLLLFSDGIGEREEEDGSAIIRRDFGGSFVAPTIQRICQEYSGSSAAAIRDRIAEYLDSLASERTDDETVVVIKPS